MLAAKKAMLSNIRDLTANFQPSSLLPREQADTRLAPNNVAMEMCQKFGDLYADPVCPKKCTLQGVPKLSFLQKQATHTLQTYDRDGQKNDCSCQLIRCELVSSDGTGTVSGAVRKTGMGQYELCYTAPRTGCYQLQVKVEGQHIQASPFSVAAVKDLTTPIKTTGGLNQPWGVAVNKRGDIIVTERGGHYITIFSGNGDKMTSFSSRGSGPSQLLYPHGMIVTEDDNILVADDSNHRIQKFSPEGKFFRTQGKKGTKAPQFDCPDSIN